MESSLRHIRFEMKKEKLEHELEGLFDLDDCFEFNASLKYELYEQSFHKILTLKTKPYDYTYLESAPFEDIVAKIGQDKVVTVEQKQQSINNFLSSSLAL